MQLTTKEYNRLYTELWDVFHACEGGYTCPASTVLSGILCRIADNVKDTETDQTPELLPIWDDLP